MAIEERNKKYYERIQGIVMDTRYLMYHYTGNPVKEKIALADCIEAVLGRKEVPVAPGAVPVTPVHKPVVYDFNPKTTLSMVAEEKSTIWKVKKIKKSLCYAQCD